MHPEAVTPLNFDEACSRIADLDLEPIAYKLAYPEEGEGWSPSEAYRVIDLYRHFLVLNGVYPSRPIVPTKEIDKVWHTHILDTSKYRADCEQALGRFLDHFPYFGMRGDKDAARLEEEFEASRGLFLQHFGVDPKVAAEKAADCGSGSCSPTCDAGQCGGCSEPPDCSSVRASSVDFRSRPSLALALSDPRGA